MPGDMSESKPIHESSVNILLMVVGLLSKPKNEGDVSI
jgi:hypothetical protein